MADRIADNSPTQLRGVARFFAVNVAGLQF
jgi:hypothetical protein